MQGLGGRRVPGGRAEAEFGSADLAVLISYHASPAGPSLVWNPGGPPP